MHGISDLGEGMWRVKIPLPFPLQWVNAYVLKGEAGVTVLDPGLRTAEAEASWEEALWQLGIDWSDVELIVLTHHHPDHYGLAGWMQEKTGAPVAMSEESLRQAQTLWGREEAERTNQAILALFAEHGFPEERLPAMRKHLEDFLPQVTPAPKEVRFLSAGDTIVMGRATYEAIHTPGHAQGHLSFWDEASGRLFCGDHVLPRITPNVSLLPCGDQDPLGTYLDSLKSAAALPVKAAFPGHRDPFSAYAERAEAIVDHHRERLERIRSLAASRQTGYAVCQALFGDKLSMHQLRFALSETLAHLIYLEKRGQLSASAQGGVIGFSAS